MELIRRDADYALRALLAVGSGDGPMCTQEIAHTQKTPFDFLQKILRKLQNAGIVKARCGSGGGFTLAKNAGEISILEILEAVQGRIAMNRCLSERSERNECPMMRDCCVRPKLAVFQQRFRSMLGEVSLGDLIEASKGKRNGNGGGK